MMKSFKYLYKMVLLALLGACSSGEKQAIDSLVGKTLEYRYGESVYHVTFDSENNLHWEAMTGEETGTKEDEIYVAEWIDSDRLFISWGEANGTAVSQVLDFDNGKVYNHLVRQREASLGEGEIRVLD